MSPVLGFLRYPLILLRALASQVRVSYVEIYNEELKDLLNPNAGNLKIVDHPITGGYPSKCHLLGDSRLRISSR